MFWIFEVLLVCSDPGLNRDAEKRGNWKIRVRFVE